MTSLTSTNYKYKYKYMGGGESNKYKRRSEQIRIKEFQLTSTNDQLRHFLGKTFCKVADMDFNFINTNDF